MAKAEIRYLAKRGYANIIGLDRSHYLIRKVKSAIQQEGLKINFKEGDASKLPFRPTPLIFKSEELLLPVSKLEVAHESIR